MKLWSVFSVDYEITKMNVPQAIIDEAKSVSLLPKKSSERYEREYADFKKWQEENNVIGVTEDVILAYIHQLSKKFSANSLWSKWSMVKSCLSLKENVDISRFHKVIAFLKRQNEGYVPKKAKVLTKEQVEKFLLEAPDEQWLFAKVVTIFGIFGCCRCDELLSLTLNDVEDLKKYIVITLRQTKNFTSRRFTITDDGCSFNPCALYRKYAALRPQVTKNLRLFLTYRNGKCVALNAGQHTIGAVPKKIAEYLGLEAPELYTGHSFRRTGATMVVDAGGDTLALKRAGGWKSTKIAESYVDDSIKNKVEMSKKMFPLIESAPFTSTKESSPSISTEIKRALSSDLTPSGHFHITGNHDCTMIFNVYESNKTQYANVKNNKINNNS